MKSLNVKKAQSGFTLIEIAIVLVIVGLLLGGVLQGQQLIENSRIRSAATDFVGVSTAALAYQDRYRAYPGDDLTATVQARGAAWTAITGGNANGQLAGAINNTFNPTAELLAFWQQLRAAGFVTGNPAATGTAALPTNPFGGLVGVSAALVQGIPLNVMKVCMNQVPGSAARSLDLRLDDGNATTGSFRGEVSILNPTAAVPGTAAYVDESIYVVCKVM